MSVIETHAKDDVGFRQRLDHWNSELERLRAEEAILRGGGGERAREKQRAKGKMTARERIAALCDEDDDFFELGLWAAYGLYVYLTSPVFILERMATSAIVIGVLLLFSSVIWERYREWLTDPYRDIQR